MAQTTAESDSDSGMGSPAEEMVIETPNTRNEPQGNTTIDSELNFKQGYSVAVQMWESLKHNVCKI